MKISIFIICIILLLSCSWKSPWVTDTFVSRCDSIPYDIDRDLRTCLVNCCKITNTFVWEDSCKSTNCYNLTK